MLEGKVIIVTGAAQGIGAVMGLGFSALGAKVMLADISDPSSAVAAVNEQKGDARGIKVDVSDLTDCERMVAETVDAFGRLDGLVCNAALFTSLAQGSFDVIEEDAWDRVMAVNVKGPWLCVRAASPAMENNGGGSIVMISTNRIVRGYPDFLHYDASKGAVHAMTRSLSRELGPRNIRINTIMPGLTMSEGVKALDRIEERAPLIAQGRALARDQEPEDLVGPTAFFLSDHSGFVAGQSLIVDGGGQVQ